MRVLNNCGVKGLWEAQGGGDFYIGPDFLCTNCSYLCHLPTGVSPIVELRELKKVEQIKTNTTFEPTTKKGS